MIWNSRPRMKVVKQMARRKKKNEDVLEGIQLTESETHENDRQPDLLLESTQMLSPVMDICEGVIVTKDDRYVQIVEVEPINFMLFPDE